MTTALILLLGSLMTFSQNTQAQDASIRVIDPDRVSPVYLPQGTQSQSIEKSKLTLSPQDKLKLALAAKAQGVPSLIFDRALENYQALVSKGQTQKTCFMAADLTSKEPQSWKICNSPKLEVTKMPFQVGHGDKASCSKHVFKNSDCLRFFGNRTGYCLPAGGRYMTQEIYSARPNQDAFIVLKGLDVGQNDNAGRNVGLQQISRSGKVIWNARSQSAFALPSTKDGVKLGDLAKRADGGMALYVYPAREDIKRFRAMGSANYWSAECSSSIGKPGWFGTRDTDAPSVSEMKSSGVPLAPKSATEPGAR